jgi:hypothetical protein
MAIAFDAKVRYNALASGATTALTVASNNQAVIVGFVNLGILTDTVTGVTWAGNAMTRAIATLWTGNGYEYIYYISGASATSGTNNIVITYTGGGSTVYGYGMSFTGCAADQTSPAVVTNSNQNTASTSISVSLTTTTANSILVGILHNNTAAFTAGTNTTFVQASDNFQGAYSTVAVASPGSSSLGGSWVGSGSGFAQIMDLKPFVAVTTKNLATLGVG